MRRLLFRVWNSIPGNTHASLTDLAKGQLRRMGLSTLKPLSVNEIRKIRRVEEINRNREEERQRLRRIDPETKLAEAARREMAIDDGTAQLQRELDGQESSHLAAVSIDSETIVSRTDAETEAEAESEVRTEEVDDQFETDNNGNNETTEEENEESAGREIPEEVSDMAMDLESSQYQKRSVDSEEEPSDIEDIEISSNTRGFVEEGVREMEMWDNNNDELGSQDHDDQEYQVEETEDVRQEEFESMDNLVTHDETSKSSNRLVINSKDSVSDSGFLNEDAQESMVDDTEKPASDGQDNRRVLFRNEIASMEANHEVNENETNQEADGEQVRNFSENDDFVNESANGSQDSNSSSPMLDANPSEDDMRPPAPPEPPGLDRVDFRRIEYVDPYTVKTYDLNGGSSEDEPSPVSRMRESSKIDTTSEDYRRWENLYLEIIGLSAKSKELQEANERICRKREELRVEKRALWDKMSEGPKYDPTERRKIPKKGPLAMQQYQVVQGDREVGSFKRFLFGEDLEKVRKDKNNARDPNQPSGSKN